MKIVVLLVALCAALGEAAITTSSYFTEADKTNANKILLEAFASNDVAGIHYGAIGLNRIQVPLPNSASQCKLLLSTASDSKATPENLYHVAIAHKAIGNCAQPLPVLNIVKTLKAIIDKEANLQEIFHATQALSALGQKPTDVNKVLKAIQALLKKNDSLANFGYYFHISAGLSSEAASAAFQRIEDAIVQADEVDSKVLHFEGGLSTTALIFNGIFEVSNAVSKKPAITNDQIVKFANYFLSRRSVQTAKGVANLLQALNNLSNNKYHVPVSITLASSASVSVDKPKVSVKVSNVLGKELGAVSVTADSATRLVGDVVVLSKKKFQPSPTDKTLFTLDLVESRPERGEYKLTVSAALDKPESNIISPATAVFSIHVLTSAAIDFVDIGAVDADQTTQGKLERVQYPKAAVKVIEGDNQQKIQLRFNIRDKASTKLMTVHQAFVRFSQKSNENSVVFIAEPDSNNQYRVDLDLGNKAGDFNHISGVYDVELIIGDAILDNSFSWKIGKVNLKFTSEPKISTTQDPYKPKPEIKHLFREPEKRPARFVSDLFSILAAVPLLILLILWARLRVNVSNLTPSLWTLTFHLGLAGIFALFALFWLRLNMFETVRYLLAIGLVTFFSGNRLLKSIAANRK